MAVAVDRDYEIKQLEYLLREERATNEYLNDMIDGLHYELHVHELRLKEKDQYIQQLRQQIEELKQQTLENKPSLKQLPAFVKLNVPDRPRKKCGRAVGHEAALRKKPKKIDQHQQVPLRTDAAGRPICPKCKDDEKGSPPIMSQRHIGA
ncbi:MAG: hypothetical protein JO353_13740 [Phycisphaerae bacterium]|nr:hypothetical protein [Phycisphaerae bacterium]